MPVLCCCCPKGRRVSRLPEPRRYIVRDVRTGLVHQAMAYDEEAYGAAITTDATWCSLSLDREWEIDVDAPLSCLSCLSEAVTGFRTVLLPGVAVVNSTVVTRIKLP